MTDDSRKTANSVGSGGLRAPWMAMICAIGSLLANTPANAVSLGAVPFPSQQLSSGKADHVQLADARRYRHCHGRKRCHGRGEYYRYTPTPNSYGPRHYAPYGYGGGYYGYGGGWWGYGGFGRYHGGHHFGGHHHGHH